MKAKVKISVVCLLCFMVSGYSQILDFGDAPDPIYSSNLSSDGARHQVNPNITLGFLIDSEADAQQALMSMGDDISFLDDEDGVLFSGWIIPGQNYQVQVYSSISGLFLNGWIDFHGNGNWTDPSDKIFTNVLLNAGWNPLSFFVPNDAVTGIHTFARFRASIALNLSFTGFAPDGEVEDYCVYIGVPQPGNIIVKPDPAISYCQNEISLALVPLHNTIVAAFNDHPLAGGPGLGVAYSSDGGQTWATSNLPYPVDPFSGLNMVDAFDPSVSADNFGNVYAAFIATDNNWSSGPRSGLFVNKSSNGGISWGSNITVSLDNTANGLGDSLYRFNDRCQIRCDKHPSSPYVNNVYTAWIKDRGWYMPLPYSDVYFSYSANAGLSFSTPLRINDNSSNMANMPVHDVASNGDIYVLWVDYDVISGGKGILYLDKSTDGGLTWGTDIMVDTILLPPIYLNSLSDVRAKGAAVLRTHPFIDNRLYIAYAEHANVIGGDESDIFLIRSDDGGLTWSQPTKINDDMTICDQIMPWMELKSDGTIDIAWYDRRNSPADILWDVYFSTSTDGGLSFSPNLRISTISFQSPVTPQGIWFGEYLGLATDDQKTYIAFTSSVTDPMGDIFFSRINNPISDIQHDSPLFKTKVYPNPVHDILNVVLTDFYVDQPLSIEIYSLTGKELKEFNYERNNFATIDFSLFPQGMYLLKIYHGNSLKIEKVIKVSPF